jgi:hypothetical protein
MRPRNSLRSSLEKVHHGSQIITTTVLHIHQFHQSQALHIHESQILFMNQSTSLTLHQSQAFCEQEREEGEGKGRKGKGREGRGGTME